MSQPTVFFVATRTIQYGHGMQRRHHALAQCTLIEGPRGCSKQRALTALANLRAVWVPESRFVVLVPDSRVAVGFDNEFWSALK